LVLDPQLPALPLALVLLLALDLPLLAMDPDYVTMDRPLLVLLPVPLLPGQPLLCCSLTF
jgi:hypothetical protein